VGKLVQTGDIGVHSHQDDLVRLRLQACSQGIAQFIATGSDRRANNRDISGGIARALRYRDGSKGPVGNAIHNQTQISEQPVNVGKHTSSIGWLESLSILITEIDSCRKRYVPCKDGEDQPGNHVATVNERKRRARTVST